MTERSETIKHNMLSIKQRIETACARSDRSSDSVCLLAVSKTKPISDISYAWQTGQRVFAENKPQEIRDKAPQLDDNISWHMIGHCQKNKVKYVVPFCQLIHSVDSYDLASKINQVASNYQKIMPIMLQVNISGEVSKYGLAIEEIFPLLESLKEFKQIKPVGLMTIPPYQDNPEENRQYFRRLKEILVDIKMKKPDNKTMEYLSMGMTNDFEIAIEEGATHIRVGTGIFGNRTK